MFFSIDSLCSLCLCGVFSEPRLNRKSRKDGKSGIPACQISNRAYTRFLSSNLPDCRWICQVRSSALDRSDFARRQTEKNRAGAARSFRVHSTAPFRAPPPACSLISAGLDRTLRSPLKSHMPLRCAAAQSLPPNRQPLGVGTTPPANLRPPGWKSAPRQQRFLHATVFCLKIARLSSR